MIISIPVTRSISPVLVISLLAGPGVIAVIYESAIVILPCARSLLAHSPPLRKEN